MKQKMSKANKIGCILLAVFLLALFSIPFWGPINFFFHIRYGLKEWESGMFSNNGNSKVEMIPSKEECSGYKKAKFYWDASGGSWFWGYAQVALCLELQYEEATYFAAKEEALSSYHFLEKPVLVPDSLEEGKNIYLIPLTETTVGDYTVKIVDDRINTENASSYIRDENTGEVIKNGDYTIFPDQFGFIAFNDEDYKIRYSYLSDYELDEFKDEKTLQGYIKRNFPVGWK